MKTKANWEQRFERIRTGQRTLEYIMTKWPKAFKRDGEAVPLHIGIHNSLGKRLREKFSGSYDIKMALGLYCNSKPYHRAMLTVGNTRVDLDGRKVGEVDDNDVIHHRKGLINKERFGYVEGYKQAFEDVMKLMGNYATGKHFTRSCDGLEAHLEVLKRWREKEAQNKLIPLIFPDEQVAKVAKKMPKQQKAKPIPTIIIKKKRILHLKKSGVKSNRKELFK